MGEPYPGHEGPIHEALVRSIPAAADNKGAWDRNQHLPQRLDILNTKVSLLELQSRKQPPIPVICPEHREVNQVDRVLAEEEVKKQAHDHHGNAAHDSDLHVRESKLAQSALRLNNCARYPSEPRQVTNVPQHRQPSRGVTNTHRAKDNEGGCQHGQRDVAECHLEAPADILQGHGATVICNA
eukprot:1137053-Pelagomonas_calceolata.AAC.1